jgi:hypothetical protein
LGASIACFVLSNAAPATVTSVFDEVVIVLIFGVGNTALSEAWVTVDVNSVADDDDFSVPVVEGVGAADAVVDSSTPYPGRFSNVLFLTIFLGLPGVVLEVDSAPCWALSPFRLVLGLSEVFDLELEGMDDEEVGSSAGLMTVGDAEVEAWSNTPFAGRCGDAVLMKENSDVKAPLEHRKRRYRQQCSQ